ncbi:MAG: hypothetical protein QNI97_15025 [Desulfobacterales bacterium]|nr:hypothetical protein [Desulfobacterales bacterium]MDJ0989089.1 hypothetical protein [Desulfobacterales bacterium]
MSGLQEILVLVLIVIVLFFLPRLVARPTRTARPPVRVKPIPGKWRLALFASAVWLVVTALWLKPWGGNLILFTGVGALPVLLFWGGVWVLSGYNRRKP